MNTLTLTSDWQQVVASSSAFIAQANVSAEIYLGSSPAASAMGFVLKSDLPQSYPIAGEVWARGTGMLVYASAP